jgi:hypothetical protein
MNKPAICKILMKCGVILLPTIVLLALTTCSPGSGTMIKLPDTNVKGLPDLSVKDVPIFSPSNDNPDNPLMKADGKKTAGGFEILFEGMIETNYDPSYVYSWYEKELEKFGWQTHYTRKYDETYKEGKLTSKRGDQLLDISIIKSSNEVKTIIIYLCTKETK